MVMLLFCGIADPDGFHEHGIPLFHLPVYYNNATILEFLIQQGLNIDVCDANGYSALMIAAKYGQIELVRKLVVYGMPLDPFWLKIYGTP